MPTKSRPHYRPESIGNCRHMVNLTLEQTAKLDAACERMALPRSAVLRKIFADGIDKVK